MQTTNINLKGVTRVPDDTACENGDLAIALNLAADGDGLKMLEQPQVVADEVVANVNGQDVYTAGGLVLASGEEVLCVHQNDGYKHYITKYTYTDNGTTHVALCWWGSEAHTTTEGGQSVTRTAWRRHIIGDTSATQATVMGNTIITQGTTMEYWLWYDESTGGTTVQGYRALGTKPPMAKIQFGLKSELYVSPSGRSGGLLSKKKFFEWLYYEDVPDMPYSYWDESHTSPSEDHFAHDNAICGSLVSGMPPQDVMDDYAEDNPNSVIAEQKDRLLNYSFESQKSNPNVSNFIDRMTDYVMSEVNLMNGKAMEEGKFMHPFLIRYCYEMYDGSQVMVSDPVLLIPNNHAPKFILDGHNNYLTRLGSIGGGYCKTGAVFYGRLWGFLSELRYTLKTDGLSDLSDWKDLITGIGIYVTPGVFTYDQAGKVYGWRTPTTYELKRMSTYGQYNNGSNFHATMLNGVSGEVGVDVTVDADFQKYYWAYDNDHQSPYLFMRIPERTDSEIRKGIMESGSYYKISEITYDELMGYLEVGAELPDFSKLKIGKNVLSFLTNNHVLVPGDYTGNDMTNASVQYVYNRRLHIANITRRLGVPNDYWTQVHTTTNVTSYGLSVAEAVEISDDGRHIMVNNGSTLVNQSSSTFPFHPYFLWNANQNATKIWLEFASGSNGTLLYYLTKFPAGGAGWISDQIWSAEEDNTPGGWDTTTLPSAIGGTISNSGEVWTSNVENPFVFQAANVNQVGDGTIKALRAAVAPLAEDQHGYAPMYVFTSQGVWAMTFSKDGTPATIDHICGDIITEGSEPLSVGQSCLMMSGRGLLELHGRTVRNLSEKVDGEFVVSHYNQLQDYTQLLPYASLTQTFSTIDDLAFNSLHGLANCKMAYDYKHQRVYVFTSQGSWVLNLKTGLWTQSESKCKFAFNAYPSCEWVSPANKIVTLDGDTKFASGLVMTRPIKLGEWQQKLREVAVRGFINPDLAVEYAQVWTALHGSRDWHKYAWMAGVKGDRLTHLGGSGYRSNIVSVILRDPSATVDRLVISYDTEQADRLR